MKRKLFLMFGMMALLVSCHSDVDELNINNPRSYAIRLDGEITRTDANGFCDGDKIGLYGVNYTNNNATQGTLLDEGNQVDNARYTYNKELGEWQSSGSIYYKDAETNIDLYAYYPYGSPENVNDYIFEVAKDQSGNDAVDGYAASDFLWGKTENITPSEDRVKIRFSHRLSRANVVLTEGSGFGEGEFNTLEKSVLVNSTIRTASIDLATGDAITAGEVEPEGIVMRATDDGWSAIVVPQSVDAGEALLAITIDGIVYRFKRGEAFTYEPGKQHTFTITVNKKAMTGTYEFTLTDCEIVDWIADLEAHGGEARQYYVVHLDEAGTLGAKIREAKKNPNKIKNLKVSGEICAVDFYFMRDSMEILQAINLKESEIVKSWRYWVNLNDGRSYHDEYFPGDMPQSEEVRQQAVRDRYPNADYIDFSTCNEYTNAHEIPYYAFQNKSSLIHFVFPEKVTKIGVQAFENTLLSGALIIPDDVIEIGDNAFLHTNISSLQLPANLKRLGYGVFGGCSSLAGTLTLPESLEEIGNSCFQSCRMLEGTLTLPSKLKKIPHYCFSYCNFSGDLIIPEGVVEIEEWAFSDAGQFKSLSLPKSLKKLGGLTFSCCEIQGELIIPSQIQSIPDQCFDGNQFTNIIFAENSELVKIGQNAFASNWRLSEPVILPDGIMTIGTTAFAGCGSLPAITIPKDVTAIGANAFQYCYYLTSIKCDATIPPVVGGGAFDGVGKDNLTLQVPEDAVARYQTANGWSEFKRISAYHDFSISRKHIRALNAGYSKTYLLRAPSGEPWSIESCPDWVTVTPSSGVGREYVTITISEMARTDATFTREEWNNNGWYETETHKGRAGEIVFKLDNKTTSNDEPVTVKMTAEQYDCDYADGDVIVNQTASQGAGVNIVFMGDCFDARDIAMGSYKGGIDEAIAYYFGIEPYKTYKPYFNIYTIFGMSPDSGMGTVNTIREAKFGSQYSLSGIAPDTQATYEYAMKATTVNESNLNQTLVVMVENTTDYGGICYMWGDGSAIAVCPMSRDAYPFDFRGIVQHEAGGHGFAKLADEYIYHNAFIENCGCLCCSHLPEFYAGKALGWYRNLSTNGDYKSVEWAHLFANPDYSNIVDMYEGGYFHTRGIFRSEATSCMNNNIPYYSAISRQEMVERIKRYAGEEFSLAEFYAKDVRDASNNDFVTRSLEVEDNATTRAAAAKQMAPKFMGDKPQLKK